MEKYITEKQLMTQLNISRSTMYRYKAQLGMPFIKIGGKTYYNTDEITIFFSEHSSHFKKFNK